MIETYTKAISSRCDVPRWLQRIPKLLMLMAVTLCMHVSHAQISYSENWNNAGNGNAGWTVSDGGRSTSSPCNGAASMRHSMFLTGTWTITSPSVGISNGMPTTLTFIFRRSSSSNFAHMHSRWSTSPTGPWTTTNHGVNNTSCSSYTVNFTPPAGQTIYIQLEAERTLGFNTRDYWFDDVSVQQQALVCPSATFSLNENCAGNTYTISANVTSIGSGGQLAYSVDGVAQTPVPVAAPGIVNIGPFSTVQAVAYTLTNQFSGGLCGSVSGSAYSTCPYTLDCGQIITLDHCYGNNDPRTFHYVNANGGLVNIKFLTPSPIAAGDGITFWNGPPNSSHLPMPIMPDLSSLGNIQSSGSELSFTIQSNGSMSCADGGVPNGWQWEVKCVEVGGCAEPMGDVVLSTDCGAGTFNVAVDLYDLGWNAITNSYPASAGIRYSIDGGTPIDLTGLTEDYYDLGDLPITSTINIWLIHENDVLCDNNLGPFTKDQLCPPANDACSNAVTLAITPVGSCPGSGISGTTFDAGLAGLPPSCSGSGTIHDVWYKFNTGSSASPITFHLQPGTIGSYGMAVHSTCNSAELACSENATTMPFTSFNMGTEYYLRVFTNGDQGAPGTFTVCASANICAPTFTADVEPICLVQFAGINNSSSSTVNGSPAFQDFTGTVAPAQVEAGGTYALTVSGHTGGNYTNYITAFFDFDNDGLFDLPGIPVGSITNTVCVATASTMITIPTTATGGISRMRLVKDWASTAVYPSLPCGTYDYGQAEDYLVDITACTGTPPVVSITSNSPVCSGAELMLDATSTGTHHYWSGPNGFSSGLEDPILQNMNGAMAGTYTYWSDNGEGSCKSGTVTLEVADALPLPAPPQTTSHAICRNSTVTPGEGLGAICGSLPEETMTAFPGGNFISEGTTLTTRATVTVPALPPGAVVTQARLMLYDVVANSNFIGSAQRQNIRVALSGSYTLAETQLTTQTGPGTISPDPVIVLANFPASGGTINLRTRQTSDQFWTNPDATIASATIEIDYMLPTQVQWFNAPTGGTMVASGTLFDPVAASLVDPSVSGSTTFYATCVKAPCATIRMPATFTVNELPAVETGTYPVACNVEAPITLNGTPVGGTWSGTGISGTTFDPAVGSQLCTYSFTDGNGCSASAEVGIQVNTATAWYADTDGDGLGDALSMIMACAQPAGHVANSDDDCPNDPLNDADGDGICGDVDECPTVYGEIGWACDPGQGFVLGTIDANCTCVGVPCSEDVTLEVRTDADGYQTTWEIREQATDITICSGGPYMGINHSVITSNCCLPIGCYELRVYDSAGDGMINGSNGGYMLRTAGPHGSRIIDNLHNFNDGFNGSMSAMANEQSFCVPLGTDRLIFTSCDKLWWKSNEFIVASLNPLVDAEWIPGAPNSQQDSDSGYEFWFFDPNGSYSFRWFRSHATSHGYGVGPARAAHLRLNHWAAAYHIPEGVMMNVRIRGIINGQPLEWGPACRFMIDPVAATCPPTKLMDIPYSQYLSCGQYREWAPNSYVHAIPVAGATQYQFRFSQPSENFDVTRTTNSYFAQLWWGAPLEPMSPGSQYRVYVRAMVNGEWCPWGDMCTLNISLPGQQGNVNSMAIASEGGEDVQFTIWPNPNRGDLLQLRLDHLGTNADGTPVRSVVVDIHDLYGKRVVAKTLPCQDGMLSTVLDLDGALAAGMYVVSITAGERMYSERLVIQH